MNEKKNNHTWARDTRLEPQLLLLLPLLPLPLLPLPLLVPVLLVLVVEVAVTLVLR